MNIFFMMIILILIFIILFLLIKLFAVKYSIREIIRLLDEKIHTDTNTFITTSTNDGDINELADKLNTNLKTLRNEELRYKNGNAELQKSITNISHDLRTPLTAINGYVDLIKKQDLQYFDYHKFREYLEIIDTRTSDLISLTEQLFSYSKELDWKDSMKKENVCINELLESVLLSYYALFKENQITPDVNICSDKVYRIVDKGMMSRAFENIISNSVKYGEKIFKVVLQNDGKIVFSNPSDKLDYTSVNRLFDRYFTVENGKKNSGIGLSIAKQFVELNGGEIRADYREGWLVIEVVL